MPLATPVRSLLFVCTGNICRSPTAEGVLRHQLQALQKADALALDSAGVDSHHVGEPPDPRTQEVALRRGVDLSGLRARNVCAEDFSRFDVILAMDASHFNALQRMAATLPAASVSADIQLYLPYAGVRYRSEVPDPYYGTTRDFLDVWKLVEEASHGLIIKLGIA